MKFYLSWRKYKENLIYIHVWNSFFVLLVCDLKKYKNKIGSVSMLGGVGFAKQFSCHTQLMLNRHWVEWGFWQLHNLILLKKSFPQFWHWKMVLVGRINLLITFVLWAIIQKLSSIGVQMHFSKHKLYQTSFPKHFLDCISGGLKKLQKEG